MTSKSDLSWILAKQVLDDTYRSDWGRLLSLLIARTRRLDLAEDALGEAFARAAQRWPTSGVPENPAGWLLTTATRVVIARLRSEAVQGRKAPLLAVRDDWELPDVDGEMDELGDERLALILLCCHPALSPVARSALALRLVIGTPTEEIARLFVVPKATMAARITRAKRKIVSAGIPLSQPTGVELRSRLDDVCRTIYLAFTAGYAPSKGPELLRTELAGEAVDLSSVLFQLVPEAPQVRALYGLLLLQHARRDARVDNGELITLGKQDRSLWRRDQLETGSTLISQTPVTAGFGEEIRLQGLIAKEHGRAKRAADTNWSAIASVYAQLEAHTGSPVVRLNRAVAVGEADGPRAGLALIEGLDTDLSNNHRLYAVRADLARRSGLSELARRSYLRAIELCSNDVERDFLTNQLNALS